MNLKPPKSSKSITRKSAGKTKITNQEESFKFKDEIVFGLVAPVGADLDAFEEQLNRHLPSYGYRSNKIKLSDFLKSTEGQRISGVKIESSSSYKRYETLMTAGNEVRKRTSANDFLAQYAVTRIGSSRQTEKTKDGKQIPKPFKGKVHILHSLKHKEEVETLRAVYGDGFFLISIHCHDEQRRMHLRGKEISDLDAVRLILRDYDDNQKFGQQTSKVYELADVFIHLDLDNLEKTSKEIQRFLDLVFGNPFRTPTRDENAMFLAYAAALRSASLSRQVGAVVTSESGEIIATGTNDTPRFGGGQYWTGESDQRDFARGFDSNTRQRNIILKAVIRAFMDAGVKFSDENSKQKGYTEAELLQRSKKILAETPLFDLTEFGRDVHAEMEALLCCARIGVSPKGGTLYTTTFPCHNCAKHIVAAGIERVVYVEPYPKSKAKELHSDSIEIESPHKVKGKVRFEPFIGVGPRKYFDLFSLALSTGRSLERKNDDGKKNSWIESKSYPRIQMPPTSYLEREQRIITSIKEKQQSIHSGEEEHARDN
jgi:deoxycytidylate deaminase